MANNKLFIKKKKKKLIKMRMLRWSSEVSGRERLTMCLGEIRLTIMIPFIHRYLCWYLYPSIRLSCVVAYNYSRRRKHERHGMA